jgi:hypothetical protein
MAELGYSGLSFPPRIGAKGGWVMTSTDPTDIAHIKESIRQIIGTRIGERVMEPTFGADIPDVVFRSMDITTANLLRFKITEALTKWEPRIQVKNISVTWVNETGHEFEGAMIAVIDFTVLRTRLDSSVTVTFRREAA